MDFGQKLKKISDDISQKYPRWKTVIGVGLIIVGLLAFVTPLTPGSWLALVGLEILGVRLLIVERWEKLRGRKDK